MKFIPDESENADLIIPYFEDAKGELGIKGHRTGKSIHQLKSEISASMSRLDGGITSFIMGKHPTTPPRHGFVIEFKLGGLPGRIEIAALPLRKETPSKKEGTLKQALFTVLKMLESQYNASLMLPGSMPLIPYLIDNRGRTMTEAFSEDRGIPLLTPPLDIVDREDSDD